MRKTVLSSIILLISCWCLLATEVEISSSPKPKRGETPKSQQQHQQQAATQQHATTPVPSTTPTGELPRYRPALLGIGPNSLINRINAQELIDKGQKDGSIMFCCSVKINGEIANVWTYRGTPDSTLLEQELVRQLDRSVFVPAIYDY